MLGLEKPLIPVSVFPMKEGKEEDAYPLAWDTTTPGLPLSRVIIHRAFVGVPKNPLEEDLS